ncbi:unnamed protein product [Gadus morhua 'NCC']
MIMLTLYVALDAPFDYTIVDMPALRRWWCIMLMENLQLDNHGKLFAHWTKESRDLLKGPRQTVMHLRKRKLEEMEAMSVEEPDPMALRMEEENQ